MRFVRVFTLWCFGIVGILFVICFLAINSTVRDSVPVFIPPGQKGWSAKIDFDRSPEADEIIFRIEVGTATIALLLAIPWYLVRRVKADMSRYDNNARQQPP